MKNKPLLSTGLLLLAAALALAAYNLWDAYRARQAVQQACRALCAPPLAEDNAQLTAQAPAYLQNPHMEMPTVAFRENQYIGILELPTLGLRLPIISQWNDQNLKAAPCRYRGSAYLDDLIISGHNYPSHFGQLEKLHPGEPVSFTDALGNCFSYTVSQIEELPSTAVEEMQSGQWDLTLFTCTLSGRGRITVRCTRQPLDSTLP